MIDFDLVRSKQTSLSQLVRGTAPNDLRQHTNDMIDRMLALIADCSDADVTFVPHDPEANDTFASGQHLHV